MVSLPISQILDFIFANIWFFVIGGVAIYFITQFLRIRTRFKPKPVNRSEVERIKFIERMKLNKSLHYKWLVRGNRVMGKIIAYNTYNKAVKNPTNKEIEITGLLIKPILFNKLKLSNPLAKTMAMQLNNSHLKLDMKKKEIILPAWMTFDYYFGIYYDATLEEEHMKIIKNDNLLRTDLNNLASIYFAKSQEQSTFSPERAHDLAMKEKELQIELAKKRGKVETL